MLQEGIAGESEYTGSDFAWVGSVVNNNDLHPWAECSNKGICDRSTGECQCFTEYEGVACQRTICPDDCNDRGTYWPEKYLASKTDRMYTTPWDAMNHVGRVCDVGYRGPACDQQECPSGKPIPSMDTETRPNAIALDVVSATTAVEHAHALLAFSALVASIRLLLCKLFTSSCFVYYLIFIN
jgi:hypothetical protein